MPPPKRLVKRRGGSSSKITRKLRRKSTSVARNDAPHLRPLTDRDNAVLDVYFSNGFRKIPALRELGYAEATCKNYNQFFDRPHIIREISRRRATMKDELMIDAKRVLQEYARIAFSNLGDLLVPDDNGDMMMDFTLMPEHMRSAISEVSVEERTEGRGDDAVPVRRIKAKTHSKTEALQALAKHLGLFQDTLTLQMEQSVAEALMAGRDRVREKPAFMIDRENAVDAVVVEDIPRRKPPRLEESVPKRKPPRSGLTQAQEG
jgi:phage terminase small subunit